MECAKVKTELFEEMIRLLARLEEQVKEMREELRKMRDQANYEESRWLE